jgi:hypothetical protein
MAMAPPAMKPRVRPIRWISSVAGDVPSARPMIIAVTGSVASAWLGAMAAAVSAPIDMMIAWFDPPIACAVASSPILRMDSRRSIAWLTTRGLLGTRACHSGATAASSA